MPYNPTKNITLYAVYKQQCTITWLVDGNAAEGSPTTKVDKGGKVTIYKILEDGTKQKFQETEISTEYLSEADKVQIKEGIRVNGKQNLNQLIEDFE